MTGSGRPHPPMVVAAVALGVQVAIEYPLTSAYGMSGAALGTLIAAAVCLAGAGHPRPAELRIARRSSRLLRLVAAGAVAFGVASLASSKVDVLPICIAATAVYIGLVIVLRVVPRRLRRAR